MCLGLDSREAPLYLLAERLKHYPKLPSGLSNNGLVANILCAFEAMPENGLITSYDWIIQGLADKKISILCLGAPLMYGIDVTVFKAHQIFLFFLNDQLVIQYRHKVVKISNEKDLTSLHRNYKKHEKIYKLIGNECFIATPGKIIDQTPFPYGVCMKRYDSTLFEAFCRGLLIPLNPIHPSMPLTAVQIALFIKDILRTLERIHQLNFVHSDPKSANLLLKEVSKGI